jgi:hypothetical protein
MRCCRGAEEEEEEENQDRAFGLGPCLAGKRRRREPEREEPLWK